MNRCLRILSISGLVAAVAAGVGCVPQDRYDQLLTTNRSLQEQLAALEGERDTSRANLDTVRNQLTRATVNLNELQAENSRLSRDLERMAADYDSLLERVSQLDIGPLPVEVESAIEDLARRYPDVLTFDARRGLLRFASDFTFDLGSVAIKPDGAATLRELARILNTEAAAGFEARIVGHTDNVPIRRAETLRNHPTNMHLSVHRAISVRDALVSDNVNPTRLQIAGYGPYRPFVPHRTGGTPENRRVEIFLVPMPTDVIPVTGEEESARPTEAPAQPAPQPRRDEPMK